MAAVAVVVLGAGLMAAALAAPGTKAGPFDPVNAAIGLAALSASLYGVVIARRADHRLTTSVPDAAARLAHMVLDALRPGVSPTSSGTTSSGTI